jgi:tetratricopeptide (TPR) repeat protein
MSVPSRGRDDVIFGSKEKKKDVPLTPELQSLVAELNSDSTAEEYKSVGNKCFAAKNFSVAIRMYTQALERDPNNEVLLSNRSASYVQSPLLAGPSLALKDAEKAISIKPTWFKAHLRKADALFASKKIREALSSYEKVAELDPTCATAVESLKCCRRELLEAGEEISPGRSVPAETFPYNAETHRSERRVVTEEERMEAERRLDTETLVKTWSQDTAVDSNTTACKKRNATLEEADRDAGKSYKAQLMSSFRKKVETDADLQQTLASRKENDQLKGEHLDFRREADAAKRTFANGTDGVGMAISAEAYKSHQYKSKPW